MSDSPEKQVNIEAPATGASASVPEVHVTPGGKSRPSVAGAKRARVVLSSPTEEKEPPAEAGNQDEGAEAPASEPGTPSGGDPAGEASDIPSTFDTAEDVRARVSAKKRKPLSRNAKIGLSVCCVILVLMCVFSMMRWVLPQDAADIQGTWAMDGAKNAVVIGNGQIDLAGQAVYDYTLDTNAKTIKVEFFTKGGSAHYRFSADRRSVAIIEQDDQSWTATLLSDIAWSWQDFIAMVQKQPRDPLGNDQGIILFKQ